MPVDFERRPRGQPTRPPGLKRIQAGPMEGLPRSSGELRETRIKNILRKEVIQPQVPLRLPCYDLVPITGFTFGACPCGLRRLRVPPALVA